MLKKITGLFSAAVFCLFNCITVSSAPLNGEKMVASWFGDSCSSGGSAYGYPGSTSVSILKDDDKKRGSVLKLKFDDKFYSGAEIDLGKSVDLTSLRTTSAIRFFVRGLQGGESFWIGLMDNGTNGKNKATVKVQSSNHFDVTDKWSCVTVPLSAFSSEGERWIEEVNSAEYSRIDWKNIRYLKFSTDKEQNFGRSTDRIATVFLDNIEVVSGVQNIPAPKMISWKLLGDTISGSSTDNENSDNIIFSFFDKSIGPATTIYPYGNRTDFSIISSKNENTLPVFANYFDDLEWSGLTLSKAQKLPIDISSYNLTGGLEFKVKGGTGGEIFIIGILDDESEGVDRRVQSRVTSRSYVKVTREWQTVKIPFSDFSDVGRWWNSDAHYEAIGNLDRSRICEVRFSTEKLANSGISRNGKEPVRLYFADVKFVKDFGEVGNAKYWSDFKSGEPDKLIEDFNDPGKINRWKSNVPPNAIMKESTCDNSLDKSKAVEIDYKVNLWGSTTYTLDSSGQDWSKHGGIKFDFFSSEPSQTCMILIVDGSNEAWYANFEAINEWKEICIPFSKFVKFEFWQPDNAILNGKLDMGKVRSVDFRPGIFGKPGKLMIDNLKLTNSIDIVKSRQNSIKVNQIGYLPNSVKRFIVTDSTAQDFALFNEKGEIVFNGKLEPRGYWTASGEKVESGDFSSVTQPGKYRLILQESGDEQEIIIGNGVYKNVFNASVKSYYYQRLSTSLKKENAGKWFRNTGFPDNVCPLHASTGKSGALDVSGGWMDAGDYGKYVVNAGITIGTLLALYELYPDLIGDSLDIPESGNGISDLLDEVRYELNWMKKMQDTDGGVFFKVGPLRWDGFILPENCKSRRFVIGKSTTSTLDFAAVMAMASRIYKFDKNFSRDCLKRAVSAWNWASQNPRVSEPSETGGTGPYSDGKYEDEFFWASCELFVTTKDKQYRKYIEKNAEQNEVTGCADWATVKNLGWYSLVTHETKLDIVSNGKNSIKAAADGYLSKIDSIPYRIPSEDFYWGSNSVLLNQAVLLCYSYQITKNRKYLDAVYEVADYIFGKNAIDYCFVTGFGKKSPLQPHHRVMASDGVDAPMPGFLVGGPNGNREDEVSGEPGVNYPFKEPAKAYVDRMAAYACNEVSINWNAPLVFVLGFINSNIER